MRFLFQWGGSLFGELLREVRPKDEKICYAKNRTGAAGGLVR